MDAARRRSEIRFGGRVDSRYVESGLLESVLQDYATPSVAAEDAGIRRGAILVLALGIGSATGSLACECRHLARLTLPSPERLVLLWGNASVKRLSAGQFLPRLLGLESAIDLV